MRWVLIVIFVLALAVGLVMGAPARLAFDALAPSGVQAGLVQGSVWRGQALRVRRGDVEVQSVDMALKPASLLALRPTVAVRVEDPAIALTAQLQTRAETVRIEDARGVVSATLLPGLAELPIPADSVARIDGVDLELDRNGRCIEAQGAIMSPALADAGARHGVDLPLLDISLSCAGEALALTLSGQSAALTLDGVIRIEGAASSYRLVATPHDPESGPVLSLLGFRAEGAQWIAEREMRREG